MIKGIKWQNTIERDSNEKTISAHACGHHLTTLPFMVSEKEQQEQEKEDNVKVTATLLCRGCPISVPARHPDIPAL